MFKCSVFFCKCTSALLRELDLHHACVVLIHSDGKQYMLNNQSQFLNLKFLRLRDPCEHGTRTLGVSPSGESGDCRESQEDFKSFGATMEKCNNLEESHHVLIFANTPHPRGKPAWRSGSARGS
jgi:hypothetical protein